MWKTEIRATFDGALAAPKEIGVFNTPNTRRIDAELCRNPKCGVRHFFPVEVVFVAHKKGPLEWHCCDFAPDVEGVHYPDRRDIAEGEETVQKRHMSELIRHHDDDSVFGPHVPELAWNSLQRLMTKDGKYPAREELQGFKALIEDRLKPACKEAHDLVKVYGRVFAHLMFDRVYFGAVQRKGVKDLDDSLPTPLMPRGLSRKARRQWIADFTALVAYSEDHLETAYRRSALYQCGKKTTESNVPKASPVFVEHRRKATAATKRLEDENEGKEAELERKKTALRALTSKIAAKTQQSAGGNDKDVIGQVRSAVRALLQRSSGVHGNPEKTNASTLEDSNPEVVLLTEQRKKLDQSNERLQDELAELRQQLTAARQQKKTAAKGKN